MGKNTTVKFIKCRECGTHVQQNRTRRAKLYCNATCKKRWQRKQKKLTEANRDKTAELLDLIDNLHQETCPCCESPILPRIYAYNFTTSKKRYFWRETIFECETGGCPFGGYSLVHDKPREYDNVKEIFNYGST